MDELALALVNYRRTFLALGEAFIAAAGRITSTETPRPEIIAAIERELTARDMTIDLLALDTALIAFIGLEAAKTGLSPRELIDQQWKAAPNNDEWRALLELARDRREDGNS